MLAAIDRVLAPVTWLAAAFTVAVLLIGPELVGADKPPPTPQQAEATAASGQEIFTTTCGGCHTLADAGTSGASGPNLDEAKPDVALVIDRVTNGKGVMPSFKGQLSEKQIQDVAAYVVASTQG